MKNTGYRFAAMALVVCLLAGAMSGLAFTITGVGAVTATDTVWLSDKATLTRNTLNHFTAGVQAERYIEWNAGGQIKPVVVNGDTVFGGTLTLDEAAAKLEAAGYSVAAGMNGDYFTVATGVPLGLTTVNGKILVSSSGLPAVGFYPDGQAFISKPELKTTLTYGANVTAAIESINRPRGTNGIFLYTSDYGESTRTTTQGVNVLLNVGGYQLTVGGWISATVMDVRTGSDPVPLTEGVMCLSAENAEAMARLNALTPGTQVSISSTVGDMRFMNCEYIIGGYRMLLENSAIVAPPETTVTRAPRSAVGIKANGTVVYYGVDGRQGTYSAGLGLGELAGRLLALGCVTAVEMDGGGSTDMIARFPGDFELTRLGRPSDGSPRKTPNHIMFINTAPKTGMVSRLFVNPGRIAALTGADIPFSDIKVSAIDANYHPMLPPDNLVWSSSNPSVAQVADSLRAVAPGTATLTVSTGGWGASGTVEFVVADRPDSIVVMDAATDKPVTELALAPNESIQLKAAGIIGGVQAPGGNFYWTTSDNYAATVSAGGLLTAGGVAGTATRLIVGMGDTVATINVLVGKAPAALEDFERAQTAFSATAVGTGFERSGVDKVNVRYGLFSGAFSYDFSVAAAGAASLSYGADLTPESGQSYLSMWIKGDGSGNLLNILTADTLGQTTEVTAATLNFTDYRQVFVPLLGVAKITGLKIVRVPDGAASGVFYLDQILASSSNSPSTSAPALTLALSADGFSLNINGSAIDYGGALLKKSDITLTMNGVILPFDYDERTGTVGAKAELPTEGTHVITLTARNSFGNYDRVTREFEQPTIYTARSFIDISEHWAGRYIELLDRRNAFSKTDAVFRPGEVITRAEVAVMTSSVLKLDEAAWSHIILPYGDLAEIPAWALGAVKAMYGHGFMTGVGLSDGSRIFSPNSGFSRAEMFGIIGNSIPKGMYKGAVAGSFTDYSEVPSWAAVYVDLLAGIGVITGADNRLNPSDTVTRAEFATILARTG
ncbi:MAG: phosphodiester glycosidase family protein [Oscillospiraceae bacterium]|nr:phosphodiester glycosidase family protein [Oscillospiraceae bacterium]